MAFFENLWWLLVLIGVMIVIHELGHYWAARWFDVRVDAFSIGFGPRLFGFRRGETDFRVSMIPFGGYVKMAGEQPGDEEDPRGFQAKPRWQRLIVVFAGPAMNIVLAVALLAGLFMVRYPQLANAGAPATVGYLKPGGAAEKAGVQLGDVIIQVENQQGPTWEDIVLREVVSADKPMPMLVKRGAEELRLVVTPKLDEKTGVGSAGWAEQTDIEVGGLLPGMDAEKKGLRTGDVLVSINGEPIRTVYTIHDALASSEGNPVDLVYRRSGETRAMSITPARSDDGTGEQRWLIGIKLAPRVIYTQLGPAEAVRESVNQNVKGATLIFRFLQSIVERRSSAKSLEGPIGIAQLSGQAAREGPFTFIGLMATVSLNLAIFNLLPIPILDGGVILLLLIEIFMRRDLSLQLKENIFKLGFVFLMMIVVFVLYNDITKLLPG
ncbi:MAG: RIP metalloprotease RseP [Bryobacteraceae bacterium]|nr:RIP metalloprotease RseP [Solibacteraceae bacterium]MCL4841845.1 RIP metalloprotease RseP [Bryobacteraceae bacterium]MCO5353015.1 RIP metalloprotease RseP [Bryobacteraceae bacterium]